MPNRSGPIGHLTLSQAQTQHIQIHMSPAVIAVVVVALAVGCILLNLRFRGGELGRQIRREGRKSRKQTSRFQRQQQQQFATMVRPGFAQPGVVRGQFRELAARVLTVALFVGIVAGLGGYAFAFVEYRQPTIALTAGGIAAYGWYRVRTRNARAWDRNMVSPLAIGLAPILGYDLLMHPYKKWLEVPHTLSAGKPDFKEIKLNRREFTGTQILFAALGLTVAAAAGLAGLPPLMAVAAGLALFLLLPAYVAPRVEPQLYERLAPVRLRRDAAAHWLAKHDPRTSELALRREAARIKAAQDAVIRVRLPHTWSANAQQQADMMSLINARLVGDWEAHWHTHRYYVEIRRTPVPPDLVLFANLLTEFENCADGQLVLGLDKRNEVYRGSLETDFPHWAFSMGTGAGKSVSLWSLMAQLIRQGASIMGIDPKMISLEPFEGVPGVELHTDPSDVQAMWDAIHRFRLEMERRMRLWRTNRTVEFRRAVLILEELNAFSDMSLAHWRQNKPKGGQNTPPVWDDIAAILRMGRQMKMNMIVVAQRLDAKATGGFGLRDSFGLRILGRYTWQAWKMLVGTNPIPRSIKKRGRQIVVDGDEHTWIQAPLSTPEEITAYALAQRARQHWTSDLTAVPDVTVTVDETPSPAPSPAAAGNGAAPARGEGRPALHIVPELYSLQDASEDRGIALVPMKYETLKYHRKTKPDFPPGIDGPNGKLYTADELQNWFYRYNAMRPTGTGG